VIYPGRALLFHQNLVATLHELSVTQFDARRALIRMPRSGELIETYYSIRIHNSLPRRAWATRSNGPSLGFLVDDPSHAVVSTELRDQLESSSVGGLQFGQPVFLD